MAIKIFIQPQTDEELEDIVKMNIQKSHQVRKKLKMLEEVNQKNHVNNITIVPKPSKQENVDYEEDEAEEEYLYYYINLLNDLSLELTEEEKIQAVIESLPTPENKQYNDIVNRIKLELLKEIQELDCLKQEESSLEFIEEIDKEKELKYELLKLINHVQKNKSKEVVEQASSINNKLIFLTTATGSICIESDLYKKQEYFESFKSLLLSIEDSSLKNVRQFYNNQALRGISQVSEFKTRIIFERLTNDTYIILGAYIVKADKSAVYNSWLQTRISHYRANRESIISKLKDGKYLELNEEIKNNLLTSLTDKKLIKSKNKGGKF